MKLVPLHKFPQFVLCWSNRSHLSESLLQEGWNGDAERGYLVSGVTGAIGLGLGSTSFRCQLGNWILTKQDNREGAGNCLSLWNSDSKLYWTTLYCWWKSSLFLTFASFLLRMSIFRGTTISLWENCLRPCQQVANWESVELWKSAFPRKSSCRTLSRPCLWSEVAF